MSIRNIGTIRHISKIQSLFATPFIPLRYPKSSPQYTSYIEFLIEEMKKEKLKSMEAVLSSPYRMRKASYDKLRYPAYFRYYHLIKLPLPPPPSFELFFYEEKKSLKGIVKYNEHQ